MASEWVRRARAKRAGRELVLTRRQALLGAAAAVAAGLAGGVRPAFAQSGGGRGRVVVIGAGFAGLACAFEAMRAGLDVVVLEARDRVGGRVFTRTDIAPSGGLIEFGAELIGANHPHWLAYAQRFGLGMRDVSGDEDKSFPVLLRGRRLSDAEVEALEEGMAVGQEALTEAAASIDAVNPWTSPEAEALDRRSLRSFLTRTSMPRRARAALDLEFEADNALPTRQQSLLGFLAMVKAHGLADFWTQTEVYRCAEGNQTLALKFAEALAPRVRLTTPAAGVAERPGGGVRVTTRAGETIDADVCVLALPPSLWPQLTIDPPLPFAPPQLGVAVKHFTPLARRPWDADGTSQYAVTDQIAVMTWDGLDAQGKDAAVLVGFSGGARAARSSAMEAEARNAAHAALYERVYPGFGAATEGRPLFANWPADPLTRAGYSFPAPGQLTRDRGAMRAGLPHLRIVGEHVSTGWPGFMEGALETGAALGKRLGSA